MHLRRRIGVPIVGLAVALAGAPIAWGAAEAVESAALAPEPAADAAVCEDTSDADRTQREAALAELNRRLSAEQPVAAGDGPLNRSGYNYDAAHRRPPAPPAASAPR